MKFMNQNRFAAVGGIIRGTRRGDGEGGAGEGGAGEGGAGEGGAGEGEFTPEKFKEMQTQLATLTQSLESVTAERDKYKNKHGEAEKHRAEQERIAQEAADKAAREAGNIEALEASWQDKLNKQSSESQATIDGLNSMINKLTVGSTAKSMASEIAVDGSASVLEPHIISRLTMEMRDGMPVVKVLKDGKPSAMTLDDLKDELSNTPAFAPIIKGSNASGSGGAGEGGGNPGKQTIKRSAFDAMAPFEKSKFIQSGGKVVD